MQPATPISTTAEQASRNQSDNCYPLIIDIDDTLLRSDFLIEMALAYVKPNPLRLLRVLWWLVTSWRGGGHSGIGRALASVPEPNFENLPVNEELVQLAKTAARQGRPVYLATASDVHITTELARRFPFLTGVIAGPLRGNPGGKASMAAFAQRFPAGFDYAGFACADLAISHQARTAILIPTTRQLWANSNGAESVTGHFAAEPGFHDVAIGLRSQHWVKNLLVFVPILLAGKFADWSALSDTFLAFVAIGITASATYLINDMLDLADDRRHWSKRYRPLASGRLPIKIAVIAAPLGLILGFLIGLVVSVQVAGFLALYLLVTLAYSFALKRIPFVDGLVLASLFTIRIAIGIVAADVRPSAWLLVFSMFLFASLGYAKRHTEITRAATQGNNVVHARGYRETDAPLVLVFGVGVGLAAVLIMILYIVNDAYAQTFYGNTIGLWFLPPLLFLFIARVWLVCQRCEMNDDPLDFAFKDRYSLALGALMAICFGLAWLGPNWN